MRQHAQYGIIAVLLALLLCGLSSSCVIIRSSDSGAPGAPAQPRYPAGLGERAPQRLWTDGSAAPLAAAQVTSVTYVELAERVNPAVVNIFTTSELQAGMSFGILQVPLPGMDFEANSLGTGFLVTEDGFIVTNNHVVAQADQIGVVLPDRAEVVDARVIGRDPISDLALLKIDVERSLPFLRLGDSDSMRVGDVTVAVGNPFGLSGTVTMGILSAKGRTLSSGTLREGFEDFLQTSAQINPGNSGGPLLNLRGEVVGVNTAIIQGAQGIGFAVPVNIVKDVLPTLARDGRVRRATIGVAVTEITPKLRQSRALPEGGALVVRVYRGGPAEFSGLRRGDVITAIDNAPINSPRDFAGAVSRSPAGSVLDVTLWREGNTSSVRVRTTELQ